MRAVVIDYDIPDVNKPHNGAEETLLRNWSERDLSSLIFMIRNRISQGLQTNGRASIMIDIR